MVGLNPLRWSGTASIDKAIQQITEVQRHNDRPISLNVLPNDFSARQHAFPTTQQALNYLLFLQKPEVQYVQEAAPQVQYIQQAPQVQYIQQEAAPTMATTHYVFNGQKYGSMEEVQRAIQASMQ